MGGDQLAEGGRRRPHQGGCVVLVLARDHCIMDPRGARRHEVRAQGADADPGAGGQLEILGHAPVENQALRRIGLIDEFRRVPKAVEAFLVESLLRLLRIAVIAGHNGRALDPDLQLGPVRHELQRHARQRQADEADALHLPVDDRDALRLGRAIHGGDRDALAGLGDGEGLEPIIEIVRQGRAAIADIAQLPEERGAQGVILLHRVGEHGERDRRGAVDCRRHLGEVADRGLEQARKRLALIDVEGAAAMQAGVEVHVGAGNVVPRQPVEGDRDLVRIGVRIATLVADTLLSGDHRAHHTLRLRHGLGHAGRAGCEEILGHGLRSDPVHFFGDAGTDGRLEEIGEGGLAGLDARHGDHRHAVERQGRQRRREHRAGLDEHRLRANRFEAVLQLAVIGAHHRVGDRQGRRRRADLRDRQSRQRLLDRIAGQDQERRVGPEPHRQKRARQRVGLRIRLAIGDEAPVAAAGRALGEEAAVRMLGRAGLQHVRGRARRLGGRDVRVEDHRSVGAALQRHVGRAHRDRAERRKVGRDGRAERPFWRAHGRSPCRCFFVIDRQHSAGRACAKTRPSR